jgi:hypothetical protein
MLGLALVWANRWLLILFVLSHLILECRVEGALPIGEIQATTLVTPQRARHGSTLPRFASTEWNHGSRSTSTDFCNKICHEET